MHLRLAACLLPANACFEVSHRCFMKFMLHDEAEDSTCLKLGNAVLMPLRVWIQSHWSSENPSCGWRQHGTQYTEVHNRAPDAWPLQLAINFFPLFNARLTQKHTTFSLKQDYDDGNHVLKMPEIWSVELPTLCLYTCRGFMFWTYPAAPQPARSFPVMLLGFFRDKHAAYLKRSECEFRCPGFLRVPRSTRATKK
ncbi:hypothetical protein B0H11DRAFT_2009536 [Mycena galericulata]|nr:hypothetical protein B0H11DRAFT_2009536 [Mycena galericulata]